jgi:uncharacterized protein (TIGR01244 family)
MQKFRQVADDFWVAPQLEPGDFTAARALGIRTVINNRPDGEAPDQLPDEDAEHAANEAGLDYVYVPVPSGGIMPDHMAAFRRAVDRRQGPFLAYCRSGTRSCYLWAFTAARSQPAGDILGSAERAGYDLSAVRPLLERIGVEARSGSSGELGSDEE